VKQWSRYARSLVIHALMITKRFASKLAAVMDRRDERGLCIIWASRAQAALSKQAPKERRPRAAPLARCRWLATGSSSERDEAFEPRGATPFASGRLDWVILYYFILFYFTLSPAGEMSTTFSLRAKASHGEQPAP